MLILFCDSGFSHKEVDYLFQEEYQAAKEAGFSCALLSFEAIKRGEINQAIKYIPKQVQTTQAIYRGWMLRPAQYHRLYKALLAKNIELVNSPEGYRFCHHLPENYATIQAYTPKSNFMPLGESVNWNAVQQLVLQFGSSPIIVKDYVKSQKHYWEEACFIPNARDWPQARKVIEGFLELQAEDLNEGLVFREFVELQAIGEHSQSGMPLTKEFRLFVLDGQVLSQFNYWSEGKYTGDLPPIETFQQVFAQIPSHFFTMDIAQKVDREWLIVELGDGQVSGLPEQVDRTEFYNQLFKKVT